MEKIIAERKGNDFNLEIEEMAQAGLHFGHKTSKTHPKMKPYLYGARSTIQIIDLEKTKEKLEEALKFIQELISQSKTLVLIGTKAQTKNLIKEIAIESGLPYVSERWLGGTFTNFGTILKRIEYFKDLTKKRESGELEKHTKKEQAKFNQELQDLEMKFGGIKDLTHLPEAIFVSDTKKENLAVKEAKKKGIKVIGIVDTDCDPSLIDYPIPANDDAISSVEYILKKVKEVILKSQSKPKE